MNIWYLSAYDQPRGKSSRTYDFALELVKHGHKVTLFTNSYCHWTHMELLREGERWRVEEVDGIRVAWMRTLHYHGNGLKRGLNMISNAWRALQVSSTLKDKPDVVVGPSVPLGTGWAAKIIAKKNNAAFVFEIRDVWPIALVDDGGLKKASPVYYAFRIMEKELYKASDRISATMPFVFDHVEQSGGDRKKVEWIPNGVNFTRFRGNDFFDGGNESDIVAMYVGGFGAAHDVITIVRAAEILSGMGVQGVRFVIVGSGPKKEQCVREAIQLNLKNIEFREPVPKSEVPKLQMEADILMACVLDSDAYRFGLNLNKIFDYFASGRPVIFSGNAPNDPIIDSGAGYTIPPENPEKMAIALKNYLELAPKKRKEMGAKGRAFAEKEFDMEVLGKNMEKLLSSAIQKKVSEFCIHSP